MNELNPRDESDKTSGFLARTIQNLGEALTGLAVSDKKDWYLSLGYVLQRTRNGRFLSTLKDEWDKYRKRGRIDEDYVNSEQHEECLQELLDFLDNDSPDQVRFSAMKQILLNAATEEFSRREDVLPQQLMRLTRKLTSGALILLSTSYELSKTSGDCEQLGAYGWLKLAAEQSPLNFKELVEIHEQTLIDNRLISDRVYGDRSGIEKGNKNFRITSLGLELCRFIAEHEDEI